MIRRRIDEFWYDYYYYIKSSVQMRREKAYLIIIKMESSVVQPSFSRKKSPKTQYELLTSRHDLQRKGLDQEKQGHPEHEVASQQYIDQTSAAEQTIDKLPYLEDLVTNKQQPYKLRFEALEILERISGFTNLPASLISKLYSLAKEADDPLGLPAKQMCDRVLIKRDRLPLHTFVAVEGKKAVVTKEQVRIKSNVNFRSNILDLNLNQKAHQSQTVASDLVLSREAVQHNLKDAPNGNNNGYFRTSLGEVRYRLQRAMTRQLLSNHDFDYLRNCIYEKNQKHEVARCDTIIMETLTYSTENQQKLPANFILPILRILKGQIVDFKEVSSQNKRSIWAVYKDVFNIYTGTFLNRYNFQMPTGRNYILQVTKKLGSYILLNHVLNGQTLTPETIISLKNALKQEAKNLGSFLTCNVVNALNIASRADRTLEDTWRDILATAKDDLLRQKKLFLPEYFTAILESLASFGMEQQLVDQNIKYLLKILDPLKLQSDAQFFLGKSREVIENHSLERRNEGFGINASHCETVRKYLDIVEKGEHLTMGEFEYLVQRLDFQGSDNDNILMNHYVLLIFKMEASKEQLLPKSVINRLQNLSLCSLGRHIQKEIATILCLVFANGQTLTQPTLAWINSILDWGRINALYALGHIALRRKVDDFPKDMMTKLKELATVANKPEVVKAATFALLNFIKRSKNISIEELEESLHMSPEMAEVFMNAAMVGTFMTDKACENLCTIFAAEEHSFQNRQWAGCALMHTASNQKSFPIKLDSVSKMIRSQNQDFATIAIQILTNRSTRVDPNLGSCISLPKTLMWSITNINLNRQNASFVLVSLARQLKTNQQLINSFSEVAGQMVLIIIESQLDVKARQNVSLALGHAAEYGCEVTSQMLRNLVFFIGITDSLEISKSIMATIGFSLKNLLGEDLVLAVIGLLGSLQSDISDSARAILEKYLTNNNYIMPGDSLTSLALQLRESQGCFHVSALLMLISEHNPRSIHLDVLEIVTSNISTVDEKEANNLCEVVERWSRGSSFSPSIFDDLEKVLQCGNLDDTMIISQAVKQSTEKDATVPESLLFVMCQVINNQEADSRVKQNLACALSFASSAVVPKVFGRLLSLLITGFSNEDSEVVSSLMKCLANYFEYAFCDSNLNEKAVKLVEERFNSLGVLLNGVKCLHEASKRGLMVTVVTLESVAMVLVNVQDKEARDSAYGILVETKRLSLTSNITKYIFQQEHTARCLLLDTSSIKLSTWNELERNIDDKNPVTISLFCSFQKLLGFEQNKSKVLALIAYISKNKQEIPYSLVVIILAEFDHNSCQNQDYQNALKILRKVVENSSALPQNLLDVLERKIKKGFVNLDTLVILKVALVKGRSINMKAIKPYLLASQIGSHPSSDTTDIQLLDHCISRSSRESASICPASFISEKSLDEILFEARSLSCDNVKVVELIDNKVIARRIADTKSACDCPSTFYSCSKKPIKKWSSQDIQQWAQKVRKRSREMNCTEIEQNEALAVIMRAVAIDSRRRNHNHELRDVQLFSVLMMLVSDNRRIAQISTGEGKSLIIAVLIICKVLQGFLVDVVTSSMVLAKRDLKEKSSLFKMFNIRVDNNDDKNYNFNGVKSCYKDDIDVIYGDASNYQFDILNHEFSGLGTRGNRNFENTVVIIDEADSMLIDESSKIAMLSSAMPGMNNLNPIYTCIWQELNLIPTRIEKEGQTLLYKKQVGYTQNQGPQYILTEVDTDNYIQHLQDELREYTKNLIECCNDLKRKGKCLFIPKHLVPYAKHQCNRWAQSAFEAKFIYKLNHHYLISKDNKGIDRIVPIDYSGTGVLQANTSWGDGLHQFLQIKEGLQLTTETVMTNFMSFKALIDRYGKRIFGLTGTVGSDVTRKQLGKIYNIDFVIIPRFKHEHFQELPTIVCDTTEEWEHHVIQTTLTEAEKGRAVLNICETKKIADDLYFKIVSRSSQKRGVRVYLYTRDDTSESRVVEHIFEKGSIIVSTNLAGRGTNIITSREVDDNGGLHVCLTFLPMGQRVEDQGKGRTSRQGNKGTAQMILNREDMSNEYYELATIEEMKERRMTLEKERLDHFEENELKQITVRDRIFQEFCKALKQMKQFWKKHKSGSNGKSQEDSAILQIVSNHKILAVEEQWGLFLKLLDFSTEEEAIKSFGVFLAQITDDFVEDKVIKNPAYHVQCGNALINYADSFMKRVLNVLLLKESLYITTRKRLHRLAHNHYTYAIEVADGGLEPYTAHYQRAGTCIQLKDNDYKAAAILDFNKAESILTDVIIPQTTALILRVEPQHNSSIESDLSKQTSNKMILQNAIAESCMNSVATINRSLKLIDINTDFQRKSREEALQKLSTLENSGEDITLKFRDLKMFDQIKRSFEAEPIIKTAFDLAKNMRICLEFERVRKEQAVELLPAFKRHPKEIPKQSEKQEEMKSKSRYFTTRAAEGASKGARCIASSMSSTFSDISNSCSDIWNKLQEAKKISVSVTIYKSSLGKCGDILAQQQRHTSTVIFYNNEKFQRSVAQAIASIEKIKRDLFLSYKNNQKKQTATTLDQASNLQSQINLVELTLKLRNITQEEAKAVIDSSASDNFTISFEDLNLEDAKIIMWNNSDNIGDSVLVLGMLNKEQATSILKKAKPQLQNVEVHEKRPLNNLFTIVHRPQFELTELKAEGLQHLIELYEQAKLPYLSISVVGFLAVAQMTFGALTIAVPGFGTTMISEGVGDMITCIRGVMSRKLNLKDYAVQKSISLTISLFSGGFDKAKDGCQAIGKGFSNIKIGCQNIIKKGKANITKLMFGSLDDTAIMMSTQAMSSGVEGTLSKVGTNVFRTAFKEQMKQAAKLIGRKVGEEVGKMAVGHVLNSGTSVIFKMFEEQLKGRIENSLMDVFDLPNVINAIRVDKFMEAKGDNSRTYQNQIKKAAVDYFKSNESNIIGSLRSLASHFSQCSDYLSTIQSVLTVARRGQAIVEMCTMVNSFRTHLEKFINKMNIPSHQDLTTHNSSLSLKEQEYVIMQQKLMTQDGAAIQGSANKSTSIQNQMMVLIQKQRPKPQNPQRLAIKKVMDRYEDGAKDNLNILHSHNTRRYNPERNSLHATISQMVLKHFMSTMQREIITPIITVATSKIVTIVIESFQRKFNSKDKNDKGRTVAEEINTLQSKKRLKGSNLSFMKPLTEEEMEMYEVDYEKLMEEAKSGKGNILHMQAVIAGLQRQGIEVQVILSVDGEVDDSLGNPNAQNKIYLNFDSKGSGHYQIMNQSGIGFVDAPNKGQGSEDCLFNCLQKYLPEISTRELAMSEIAQNKQMYLALLPDRAQVERNSDLFGGVCGGATSEALKPSTQDTIPLDPMRQYYQDKLYPKTSEDSNVVENNQIPEQTADPSLQQPEVDNPQPTNSADSTTQNSSQSRYPQILTGDQVGRQTGDSGSTGIKEVVLGVVVVGVVGAVVVGAVVVSTSSSSNKGEGECGYSSAGNQEKGPTAPPTRAGKIDTGGSKSTATENKLITNNS